MDPGAKLLLLLLLGLLNLGRHRSRIFSNVYISMHRCPMAVHVATLGEGLRTVRTGVRLLPGVRPPVFGEGAEVAEALVTERTVVGALAGVNPLVGLQAASLDEVLRADGAPIAAALLALVAAEVGAEAAAARVHLAALGAAEDGRGGGGGGRGGGADFRFEEVLRAFQRRLQA